MGFNTLKKTVIVISVIFLVSLLPASSLEKGDNAKVLGYWDLELDAEGDNYYLSMTFEESNGKLSGKISEFTGSFENVPLKKIVFDGEKLTFEFTAPTPPDGMDRLLKAVFKIGEKKLEGFLNVPDLTLSATVIGKWKKV